jgi:hypothetical protein
MWSTWKWKVSKWRNNNWIILFREIRTSIFLYATYDRILLWKFAQVNNKVIYTCVNYFEFSWNIKIAFLFIFLKKRVGLPICPHVHKIRVANSLLCFSSHRLLSTSWYVSLCYLHFTIYRYFTVGLRIPWSGFLSSLKNQILKRPKEQVKKQILKRMFIVFKEFHGHFTSWEVGKIVWSERQGE